MMELALIARVRSPFGSKFAVPRQSGLAPEVEATLVFEPPYRSRESLRGIEGFSHLWLKLPEGEIDRRVREAAAFVGIGEPLFEKSPLDLSGGQKRRAAIAGVLAMEPELLILDEPTAGLDPAGREDLLEKLFAWRAARNATILLVTHDMDAAALCDRLAVLDRGKVVMCGAPEEIFSHARQLQDLGLDLPEAAHIALLLRQKGFPLPESIYTLPQLRDAVLALWRKGDAPC